MAEPPAFRVGDTAWIHAGGKGNPLVAATVEHAFDLWGRRHYVVSLPTSIDPLLEVRDAWTMSDDPKRPIGLHRR